MQMIADTKFFVGMLVVSLLGMIIMVRPTKRKKKNTEEKAADRVTEEVSGEEGAEGSPEENQ